MNIHSTYKREYIVKFLVKLGMTVCVYEHTCGYVQFEL